MSKLHSFIKLENFQFTSQEMGEKKEKTIYVQIFTFYAPESTWKNIVKKLLTKCCSLSGIYCAADDRSLLVSS